MIVTRSLSLVLACAWLAAGQAPQFSFGVVADIQYADQASAGRRDYRGSIGKLESCVAAMNREKLDFVIQLGDLVDSGADNLERILNLLKFQNKLCLPLSP